MLSLFHFTGVMEKGKHTHLFAIPPSKSKKYLSHSFFVRRNETLNKRISKKLYTYYPQITFAKFTDLFYY